MGDFIKYAVLTAATVFTVSSFVGCDKEDDKDEFVSETIKVSLTCDPDMTGFGPSHSYHWQWMNCDEAAVVAIKNPNFVQDSLVSRLDTIDFRQFPFEESDATIDLSGHDQVWEFQTKETGVRELKFNYYKVTSGIRNDTNGVHSYSIETLLRDTVIKF